MVYNYEAELSFIVGGCGLFILVFLVRGNNYNKIKFKNFYFYFQDSDGPYYWHIKSGTIQRQPPQHEDSQDQVSNLVRNVRSSRIFDSNFDGSSLDSDYIPSTGMPKSCTASSIADLGKI